MNKEAKIRRHVYYWWSQSLTDLYAKDTYWHHTTFSLWCHFWQCLWDFGSAGWIGWDRGRWAGFNPCPGNTAASRLSCRKPLVSTGWAVSLLLCMNWLRKLSSGRAGPPLLAVKLFSHSVGANIGQEPCLRQWVWFESWMCTGWLQWHLCEFRSFKTHLKWKYGMFKGSIGLKWLPQKRIQLLIS